MMFTITVMAGGRKVAEVEARDHDAYNQASQLAAVAHGHYRNAQGVLVAPPEVVVTITPIDEGQGG
jgi:hypothetical protein